jgi:hypothetical protein
MVEHANASFSFNSTFIIEYDKVCNIFIFVEQYL